MSRSTAILLLTILLCPMMAHRVFFKLRKDQLRHELKEQLEHRIPKADLDLIKVPQAWMANPPAHFQRIDKNEFRLNGDMYDIVYRESRADTLWLYCLADEAETLLFAQLEEWVAQQSSDDPFQRGRHLQWKRLLNSLFPIHTDDLPTIVSLTDGTDLPPYHFSDLPWQREAISPPPKP